MQLEKRICQNDSNCKSCATRGKSSGFSFPCWKTVLPSFKRVSRTEQAVARRAGKKKLFGRRAVLPGVGIYLDGGFGVGKTHLLASSFFANPEPKAFATFGELTQLAGVFGFVECIELLADYVVVCIDEFELDDRGNTTAIR